MVPFDVFNRACVSKIIEYKLPHMDEYERNTILDGYLKTALARFNKICEYELVGNIDSTIRMITTDIPEEDLYEIVDIVSEAMVALWCQKFVYNSENLQLVLNGPDFSTYSPNELIKQVNNVFKTAQSNFKFRKNKYSFEHGDLEDMHI